MIALFITLLLLSCAFCVKNDPDRLCLKNDDCFVLQQEIVNQRNVLTDPCTDAHTYMCTFAVNDISSSKKPLRDSLSYMTTYLINLLTSPPKNDDSELLKIEKKLFGSCMQLESTINQDLEDYKLLKSQLISVKKLAKWQNMEYELFKLGFGSSFFDIKVIPHPEYESMNAVLLQPPSLENIRRLVSRLNKIINFKRQYRRKENMAMTEPIHELYDFLDENTEPKVIQFFEMLERAKLGLTVYSTGFPEYYTTVKEFNNIKVYAAYKFQPDGTIKGDWIQIVNRSLQKLNISFESDNIILKNPKYFLGLTMLLHDHSNDVIVAAIRTKSITDNLAYLDWDLANSLEIIDRPKFCLGETKLYGASRMLVHDWVNEDDDRFSSFLTGERIIANILSTIRNELSTFDSETPSKTAYYKRKLLISFESLKKYVYEPPYNLYKNFSASSKSHFKNIIGYRKMLIDRDLENLQEKYESMHPFSFIDSDEPQNRFVIHTLIHLAEMFPPDLPKEVHYGTFGTKTAVIIHALLQEDTFNEETVNTNTDKSSNPKYSENTKYCTTHELNIQYSSVNIDDTVSQILGLNTAFNASNNDAFIFFEGISDYILSRERITRDKLFFLAYIKDNCHQDSKHLNDVLSHNFSFDKAFNCSADKKKDVKTCIF